MRKVLLLFVSLLAVVGLSACDMFGDNVNEVGNDIVNNWDGSLEHVELVMENMNLENTMTQTSTMTVEIVDGMYSYTVVNTTVDRFVFGEYDMLHRTTTQEMNMDGEIITVTMEVIYVEVATGVNVYVNMVPIKQMLQEEGLNEVAVAMTDLGITEDWAQFNFDDSLSNVIEIEVLKDLLRDILFKEIGVNFFYDLQTELETNTGFDFSPYGVDFGLFMDYMLNEQFVEAETLFNNIDFENLLDDFEAQFIIPQLKNELTENATDILVVLPTFDVEASKTYLQTNGLQMWYENLSESEEAALFDYIDEGYVFYYHAQIGDLPNFLLTTLLSDPYTVADLEEIPGLDVALLQTNAELIDFAALKDEVVDYAALLEAMYYGEDSFNTFLASISSTAPNHVLFLEPFSGVMNGTDDIRALVDDINLGFENLDMFSEYFTLQYYTDSNMATAEMSVNEAGEVVTTIQFENYGYLFDDLFTDVYWYLDGFNSFEMPYVNPVNCPAGEYCETVPVSDVVNQLNQFGPINATITYDPVAQDNMEINVDVAPLINEYMMDMGAEQEMVQTMEFNMVIEDVASITLPTSTTNMNDVLQDFAKFSLYFQAWDMMREVYWEMDWNTGLFDTLNGQTVSIQSLMDDHDVTFWNLSLAFDADLSTITVGGTAGDPSFAIDLYWIDGTRVFTSAITMAELDPVIGNGSGAPDATEYATYLAKIDPANFNMTKLFLTYLLREENLPAEVWIDPDMERVYSDALAIQYGTEYFCADNTCMDSQTFTWAEISPYVEGIDMSYYVLEDTTVVSEIYYGYIYVYMEAQGTGNYEFPTWIMPTEADPTYVEEDWD